MEKLILTEIVNTGRKTSKGMPIIECKTDKGEKVTFFSEDALKLAKNEVIELELKDNGEYQGVKQFIGNLPKAAGQSSGSKFPQKDWTFEKRKFALSSAIEISKGGLQLQASEICKTADEFLTWLNK